MAGLNDVHPEEITFLKHVFTSDFSVVYFVAVRGQKCIMKTHKGCGPRMYYDDPVGELDIHMLEYNAYRRLQDRGLCDRGIVPHLFGSMRRFDPALCQPQLAKFLEDEQPPSALFLEYIPDLQTLDRNNHTPGRFANWLEGLRQMHEALVLHDDVKPRNLLFVKDTDRAIWVDFDRAQTFDEGNITAEEQDWIAEEMEIFLEIRDMLEYNEETAKKWDEGMRQQSLILMFTT